MNFAVPPAGPPRFPGLLSTHGSGREWRLLCHGSKSNISAVASQLGAKIVDEQTPSLDEIFVARAKQGESV